MKIINFKEYSYVLHEYVGSIEISKKDYKNLKTGKLSIEDISSKYVLDYQDDEAIYEDSKYVEMEWDEDGY